MPNRQNMPQWIALQAHQNEMSATRIQDLFKNDTQRFDNFSIGIQGCVFDYSKHKITDETMDKLCALAKACDLEQHRDAMFAGDIINKSENRAVLHTALRGSCDKDLVIDGENVSEYVTSTLERMRILSEKIRKNPQITDVVNIGIGGSDLGPRMAYKALNSRSDGPNMYFISNMDARALAQRLKGLEPKNTLFIISSKSFKTPETLANAQLVKEWLNDNSNVQNINDHFIAITSNIEAAQDFGITDNNILTLRDWIGGRMSICSAVGLPIAIANGFDAFKSLLEGARAADEHFQNAPFEKNIPLIMAMLGIWYRNFWGLSAQAVLPYSHGLRELPIYMQQLEMESNGKGVSKNGDALAYASSGIVFGEAGTNAQHTFMQLLHQGTEIIPADFIMFARANHEHSDNHTKLLANALAQSDALMQGHANKSEPYRNFEGNRPSSIFIFDTLNPYHLGMLIALYEHKVFVQGIVWDINSFDQWGVELGKLNAVEIEKAMIDKNENKLLNASTAGLIKHIELKS